MNFFSEKNKKFAHSVLPSNPVDLFNSLNKSDGYSYLRAIQDEVLKTWYGRRDESHLLIKMNTGAGKTLIGLLMLYSKMLEFNKPVVFLCPDKQLLSQVLEQSNNFSIPTCEVDENRDFPEEFVNAEAILIATADRLFNGKNIFDRERIVPKAILIDDAHRCVQRIIDSFTIRISHTHELYSSIINIFKEDLRKQSIGSFEMLDSRAPGVYMRVPYWAWLDKKDLVFKSLTPFIGDKETLLFKWDLFRNNYEQHELYIINNRIEISPIVSHVRNIVAYNNADFKYALSATFENDYDLIKHMDFPLDTIKNPIVPSDRKDYGERLILAPRRYFPKITDQMQIEILLNHKKAGHNLVVLVPNNDLALRWEKIGARIIKKENIESEIENLKNKKGNFVVFVNRYEGIDLSGHSCNVLILHSHPQFKSIKETYYQDVHHQTSSSIVAQTIEQGMGRSVRSSNDYSVIYLLGREILKFLRYNQNLQYFNDYTQKQISLGLDLLEGTELTAENVVEKITGIAEFCLSQHPDWKIYYRRHMEDSEVIKTDSRDVQLSCTHLEKEASYEFINKNYQECEKLLHNILGLEIDVTQKAWYYQLLAHFKYPIDKNQSNDYQIKSRSLSRHMLEPFAGSKKWKKQIDDGQVTKSLKFIQSFSTTNDLLGHIGEFQTMLIYSPNLEAEKFEAALNDLGELLGFESSRPEKERGEGPDVLWSTRGYNLILEAKSEKFAKNKINKKEIGQIHTSISWFKEKYTFDGKIIGISLQPNGF